MAVIKFGSIVTSGRGSLGGSTIQPCHSGHIWRNKPTPTKSRTQAQSLIRSYNKAMQAGWKALSDQDRRIWNDYAKEKPVFNRTGEKHPLSGHSLWLKYQFPYLSNHLPFLSNPFNYLSEPLGPELVINGNFETDTDWVKPLGATIHDGALHYINLSGFAYQSSPWLNSLNQYLILFVIDYGSSLNFAVGLAGKYTAHVIVPGSYVFTLAGSDANKNVFLRSFVAQPMGISYISVKQIL